MAAAAVLSNTLLESKFRGCMVGGLMGDCLGCPFEFLQFVSDSDADVLKFFTKLLRNESSEILEHTDDSEMTISVASSLVEMGEIDAKDMAKRFVDKYCDQPNEVIVQRNYGNHVVHVFRALRANNCSDVFSPAKQQFNGAGSFGNGAAMRIAPVALFGYGKDQQFIVNAVKECSHITHTHLNGYNGAILQCLAVSAALELDSSQTLDPVLFIDNLQEKMKSIETEDTEKPYCRKLQKIKDICLKNQEDISAGDIAKSLGNDVTALGSVPTAIYSFLRGMKPLKDNENEAVTPSTEENTNPFLKNISAVYHRLTKWSDTETVIFKTKVNKNPFLRTLYFAILVGGDTDTIASMAGSIAGAYYGIDMIPKVLQKKCEHINEVYKLADKLFEMTLKK